MNLSGIVRLDGSHIDGNTAQTHGGGIANYGTREQHGRMTLADSTVTRNSAGSAGGGIAQNADATTTLVRTTVARNAPDNCSPASTCR